MKMKFSLRILIEYIFELVESRTKQNAIVHFLATMGGFHESWAQGVQRKEHPNLGENAISWT
jgi:hypothetical protein